MEAALNVQQARAIVIGLSGTRAGLRLRAQSDSGHGGRRPDAARENWLAGATKSRAVRASLYAAAALALVADVSAAAQVNNNANTPLGSRIRRDRAFPNEPIASFNRELRTEADRQRSHSMQGMLARCMWDRGNEKGLSLIERTDLGFSAFEQIGLSNDEVDRHYPISLCLGRVAERFGTGVSLRFGAAGLRQSYIEAAYFDIYPDGPTWLQPGLNLHERTLPLSASSPGIVAQLDFVDCVVLADAQGADYFFRTAPNSEIEHSSLLALVPAFNGCAPEGTQLEINPRAMRIAIGEGLWHAARHNSLPSAPAPASAETPEESQ